MTKNRIPILLALIVGAIALLLAAILGLWGYKSLTAPILHPDPQHVRSVTHSHPSRKWTDAVERGRQIIRTGLIQQNLPGLSVAVGVDGDVVWAEGFGHSSTSLEKLDRPLVLLRGGFAAEGSQIAAPSGARIHLARVQAVLTRLQLADHHELPSVTGMGRIWSGISA